MVRFTNLLIEIYNTGSKRIHPERIWLDEEMSIEGYCFPVNQDSYEKSDRKYGNIFI